MRAAWILLDRFNRDNSNVRVDRACQNCVYAAVCADIDETAGALEVIENYRRSLSFPLSQAGPEYPMANGVKFGGKPSASAVRPEDGKRLEHPSPRQIPSQLGGQNSALARPGYSPAKRVEKER